MDEHMGRRTVGGLLFTKGGSILLFREDSSRRKAGACCSRHGCNGTRHSADKSRPMHSHRDTAASAAAKEAAPTPRKSQRKPPQGSSNNAAGSCSETGNGTPEETATAPRAGRDLLARLKDRVNASRKRSLAREMSSPSSSSSSGFSAGSSSGGVARSSSSAVSRPTRRAVSRIRKAEEGENAGGGRRAPRRDTGGGGDARGNSGDMVTAEQRAAREQPPAEGFISGFLARYRSGLHGGSIPSLQDGAEDSGGYWRFDVEGSEELENYFMLSDRHRAMRMDIDNMSYEELLALGDRIGTVNTGLSEEALYKCLKRSLYVPTAPETHQDCDRKCSICQEEYSGGEEVGKMACKHYYHITCIQHWLRQKNWCPICKSVAARTN